MRKELKLRELLAQLEAFCWFLDVYIKEGLPIGLESSCLIINDDEENLRCSEDEPIYPKEQDYKGFLSISDLESIKENLSMQISNPDQNLLLKAVIYYFENDAFISISNV